MNSMHIANDEVSLRSTFGPCQYTETLPPTSLMKINRDKHPAARVIDATICSRRAVRRFKPDNVPRQVIEDILDVARYAPSNSNIQPWHVYVVSGDRKAALSEELGRAPLRHMPDPLPEVMRLRQEAFGSVYYGALGVSKGDMQQRAAVTATNFDFFGAPVGLIFAINSSLTKFSWLDYGLFLQSLMLAAKAVGLATCPQVSFARYDDIIARRLKFPEDHQLVCGMSLGFPDEESHINNLEMPRERVEGFATFVGFDDITS
ncbi:nitroreductase [Paraburkholderia fungorum]|uniref:nitroreductase n=1 Tax=Paraburkholderia fungorum TaxID=134537 RepID=UPI0038BD492A